MTLTLACVALLAGESGQLCGLEVYDTDTAGR